MYNVKKHQKKLFFIFSLFLMLICSEGYSNDLQIKITDNYLNIPIGKDARMKEVELSVDGETKRKFPVQLAEDKVDYWIYIHVSEFKNQTITLSAFAKDEWLSRIYQDDKIAGSDTLYNEVNRPQYHYTVKRGWSNDINGPIYYNNQYHLFYQNFPFGTSWNTGYMYWGHAVSDDLLHWKELPPALRLDSLGSPWSGSAVIDKNNDAGFGENALVLHYTSFDRISGKQVQSIAYSTDGAQSFKRYEGNPVLDNNKELGTTQTRDPKVFWHEPSERWVMVLWEVDGMTFYNSTDMKNWERQSHFAGLHECPDFFELPVDGDPNNKKWIIHGGSSEYFIGRFDGKEFIPESPRLDYSEGENRHGQEADMVYAGLTFENMPDDRRVHLSWGRWIDHGGNMPFAQMVLFPVEFKLKTTEQGLRMMATPIEEIAELHLDENSWSSLTAKKANEELKEIKAGPLHLKANFELEPGHSFGLRYNGNEIVNLVEGELPEGENSIEILVDKSVAEIFVNGGERYIVKELKQDINKNGFEFDSELYGPFLNNFEVFKMKSIWKDVK